MLAETLDPWTNSSANKGGFYDTGRISRSCVRVCTCARAHRGRGTEVEWMEAGSWSSGPALLASTRRGADFITHASLSPLHGLFLFSSALGVRDAACLRPPLCERAALPQPKPPSFLNTPQIDLMCAGQSAADLSPLISLMLVLIVSLLLIGCRLLFKTDDFLRIISLFSKTSKKFSRPRYKKPRAECFQRGEVFSTLSLQGEKKKKKAVPPALLLTRCWPHRRGLKCSAARQCTRHGWIYCQRSEVTGRKLGFSADSVTCETSSVICNLVLLTDTE